ncbi:MAG: M56 family metallopeptidase [Eubacterium sp.]|nr:M56 family metallopeptidase [Eubacterium sp.]
MGEWFIHGLLFRRILAAGFTGSYCLLIVMLARLLLLKCGRKYICYLWIAAFLNFVIPSWTYRITTKLADTVYTGLENLSDSQNKQPLSDGSSKSIGAKAAAGTAAAKNSTSFAINAAEANNRAAVTKKQPAEERPADQTASANAINRLLESHSFWLQPFWLLGVFSLLICRLIHILKLKRQTDRSRWMYWDSQKRTAEVEGLSAPFVWGLIRPVIYLPAGISETERGYITAHESCHRSRLDPAVKAAVSVVTAVYWFHPMVWAAWFLYCQDVEIACDEEVLAYAQKDIKKQYAQSLLKYAASQNRFLITPLSFGAPSVKARIKHVLRYQKQGIRAAWLSRCAVLLVIMGLSIRPAAAKAISLPYSSTAAGIVSADTPKTNASDGSRPAALPRTDTADRSHSAAPKMSSSPAIDKTERISKKNGHRKGYAKVQLTRIQIDSPYFTPGLRSEKKLNALAQKALRELYDLTGYQVTECVYECTDLGGFMFAKTVSDLKHGRCFYSRSFGSRHGYGDNNNIESFYIADARTTAYSDIQQLDLPAGAADLTDARLSVWFLKRSHIYRGEKIASTEPSQQAQDVTKVLLKDGSFYEVYLDRNIQAVSGIYGPYPKGFSH